MATTYVQEVSIALLATGTAAMKNGDGKTTIYTVPADKKATITQVVIRQPTVSLAGGTNYNIGDGANADTWRIAINLSGMTGTNDYMVVTNNLAVISAVFDAGDEFGIKPVTGATADAEAEIDVYGREFDA